MRKKQKQEILKLITTMHKAHGIVYEQAKSGDYVCAQDILVQCQECAICIGDAIGKSEGESAAVISDMEEYCDLLFRIYQELDNADNADVNKIYNTLEKQLLRIEDNIERNIGVRKEIVFFPYKASMWDSLESVYLAAKENLDCDAYCVPIPYYDLNPDHSFGRFHYEGGEYPKNIEITDWREYDLEERKPDVIYIHNPYDDCNTVTSVHPRYYSANLKKYTQELVYIPYFVLLEIEPDDQAAVDGMKHFCFLPGIIHADKVIVQSEKMKQIYVNEYLKAAKENGLGGKHTDRKLLEEKFLGLGSPKLDKVQNTKKEDLEIPQEWLKVIEKTDGSWKKIIFYNTSIAALLEHKEKMLEKMEDVFRIFKENKAETALLWRPHPLIENTVKSMLPQLWEEYEKLVERYKAEGWGIYDDTADLDRAIVISDGYYGDKSSVLELYQKTGKPLMIQDVYVNSRFMKENAEDVPVWPADFCVNGNDIWLFHGKINMLIRYNMLNDTTSMVGSVPEEKMLTSMLYANICQYKGKIFLVPCRAKEVAVYDTERKSFKKIPLRTDIKCDGSLMFCRSFAHGKYLYCIPYCYHSIVRIDMDKMIAEYKTDAIGISKRELKTNGLYINDAVQIDEKIVCAIANTNAIGIYDINSDKFSVKIVKSSKCDYRTMAYTDGRLFLYDVLNSKIDVFSLKTDNLEGISYKAPASLVRIGTISSDVIVDFVESGELMVRDSDWNLVYEEQKNADSKSNSLKPDNYYGRYKCLNTHRNKVLYYNPCSNRMYLWENYKTIKEFGFRLTERDYEKVRELTLECSIQEKENELVGLKELIKGEVS